MLDKSSMHRLIGAGVMLIAAVCVLPIILDGERPDNLGSSLVIPPPAPDIITVKVKPVQSLPVVKKADTEATTKQSIETIENKKVTVVKKLAVPKNEQPLEATTNEPTSKKALTPSSATNKNIPNKKVAKPQKSQVKPATNAPAKTTRWVVQIASFKNRNNARELVKRLQSANYAAYTVTTKTLYKVFVGPEIKKSRSEAIKQEIKQKFRLEGFVVKYAEK